MNKSNENIKYAWVLFIIWPFGTFLYALNNIFSKNSQLIVLVFSFLFGYSVFFNSGGDILRFKDTFEVVTYYTWDDFIYLLTNPLDLNRHNLYELNSINSKPDIYALFLSFFISRFTDDPRWFWAFASAIYTFTVLNLFNSLKGEFCILKNNFSQNIFLIGLFLIVPFYVGVTGIRFWPALFIFTTYAIKFYNKRKLKYVLLTSLSMLFHYSFFFPFIIFLLFSIIPNNRLIHKVLLIIGIAFLSISSITTSLKLFNSVSSNFEETTIERSMESYGNEELVEQRNEISENKNWYVKFRSFVVYFALIFIAVLDIFGILKFKENNFSYKTFPLYLIFLLLSLFTNQLGSIGRFQYVFYLLFFSRFLILSGIQPNNNRFKWIAYVLLPVISLHAIVSFRAGFYYVEPTLLINNSIAIFFTHSDISLSEFLIGH